VDQFYDEFVSRFTERLLSSWSGAPLSSPQAADTLADQVDRAVAQGAHLEMKGQRDGCYVPAGVLTDVGPDNDVLPGRSSSIRSPQCIGPPMKGTPSNWRTTRRTGWGPTSSRRTRFRHSGSRTASTPAWCLLTA
jgi:hypothetical protein